MVKIKFIDKFFKANQNSKIKKSETTPNLNEDNLLDLNDETKLLNLINENFTCNCCLEVLRLPVTLTCGHSFCQLCIANWYLASSNKKCPTCRQEWAGVPQLNHLLKTTIITVVKHEISQPTSDTTFKTLTDYLKKCEHLSHEENLVVKKFEDKSRASPTSLSSLLSYNILQENQQRVNNNPNNLEDIRRRTSDYISYICYFVFGFFIGLFAGFLVFSLIWLLSSAMSSQRYSSQNGKAKFSDGFVSLRKKYTLQTEQWGTSEVEEWLQQLGPWTTDILYSAKVLKLDGSKLLELNHTILKSTGIQDEEIRSLLLDSIKVLKKCHLKTIDFWEIKNANKLQVVITSLIYETFPRLFVLYNYYFENNVFKMFTKIASKNILDFNDNDFLNVENLKKNFLNGNSKLITVNYGSFIDNSNDVTRVNDYTLGYFFRFPYLALKNLFSIFFYETNKVTSIFVSINCIILTFLDIVFVIDIIRTTLAHDIERIKTLFKSLVYDNMINLIILLTTFLFWNFLPNILIDTYYFYFIFIAVFFNINKLLKNSKSFFESIAHYFIRPSH